MTTRRDALKQIGAAAVATSALAQTSSASAALASSTVAPPAAPPWALLAPLAEGSELGGWSLGELMPVRDGATVLVLHRGAEEARVHLCARRGEPAGLAHTDRFDLLLMNGGSGSTRSREDLGRVVLTLAERVSANSDEALAQHPELRALLTHSERVAAFDDCGREVLT